MANEFKDKVILVTGGTGSIGSGLVAQFLKYEPRQVRVLSRDESKQYDLLEKLNHPANLRMFIGDIRDKERLELAFTNVDIVIHAAALKHVPFCEYNPFEAVKTNIIGSQNVIDAALKKNVKNVIAISTDKAANPVNIMGTSKLMMEKLFVNANYYTGTAVTKFSCVRFGNVIWSRGSVFPLWKNQVNNKRTINITNGDMTRFFMSKKNASKLVLDAIRLSKSGEIFIFKMPAIKLNDLAKLFIKRYYPDQNIQVKFIGNRAGEKFHEDLLIKNGNNGHILENDKMFIIIPEKNIYCSVKEGLEDYHGFRRITGSIKYSSNHSINMEEIKEII